MDTTSSWLMALADPLSAGSCPDLLPDDAQPWRSIASGVAQLLRSETGNARATLENEYRLAADARAGGRALLALAVGWLAEVRHFNLFPDGCGAGSIELELRWNGVDRAAAFEALATQARSWPDAPAVRLAYRWLQFVAVRLPGLAIVRDASGHPQKDLLLQLQVQQYESVRDDARALSLSALGFVERSMAELLATAGERSRAEEALARAIAAYGLAEDEAGLASCSSLRGDWLVAPISSALVRNLRIADVAYPTSELSWMIEAVEGGIEGTDFAQARGAFEDAMARYERAGRPRGAASVLLRLAYLARLEGQLDRQIELAQEAQRRFTAAGDLMHAHLATTHCTLALLDARRFPEDRQAAAEIGSWGRQVGSFSYALGLGLLFTRAGRQTLLRDGDYEKAEACFQLALALNEALGARCRWSQTQADLAALHQALGNRERSQTHLEDAIEGLLQVDAAGRAGHGGVQQRAVLLMQQMYREALDHRDAPAMERSIKRMAGLDPQAGDLSAYAVKSFLGETREQASVLIPLYQAVDRRNAGSEIDAERLFDEALVAAERAGTVNGNLWQAVVQATRRRYAEAVAAFERYQQAGAAQAGLAGSLISAMQGLSESRAQREAEMARRRSLEQSFAFMVRAKAYDRAAAYLQELVQLTGPNWWADDERPWRSLSDIAEMHEGHGQYDVALAVYEKAIDELERRRSLLSRDEMKTALAADFGVQYLYFQAVRAAMKSAAAAKELEARRDAERRAFTLSERGRARALLDLIGGNLRQSRSASGERAEFARWRALASSSQLWRGMLAHARSSGQPDERVEALRQKIQVCEQELYQVEQSINRNDPEAAHVVGAAAKLSSLDEIAERLAPGTAMLQYMTLGEELLVWAVTWAGMVHPRIQEIRAAVLTRLVREFHENCAQGAPLNRVTEQAVHLGELLLDPVGEAIDENERLIITPYGELNLLPFAALRWREDWLGKQRTISHLPSASMLSLLSRRGSAAVHAMLAVGNPQAMSHQPPFGAPEPLPPLEHAETEARSVAKLYATNALIGPDATIEKVQPQLSTHRQLHFATHGVLYEEAPLLSGCALANGYVLTVQELMGLRLDADLITVSACKSGLGERTGGEEIVGLTRGLFVAGARNVIVSLWPVLDLSTAVLMVKFHQCLKGADVATALREAQSWLSGLSREELGQEKAKLRDLVAYVAPAVTPAHPQHWAPFVLIGE